MEKILRKVKCNDRPPSLEGYQFVLMPTGEKRRLIFVKLDNTWYSDTNEIKNPEYWYEEVDLLDTETCKMLLRSSTQYRELSEQLQVEANERYEKSYQFFIDRGGLEGYLSNDDYKKALKIATGINKGEI